MSIQIEYERQIEILNKIEEFLTLEYLFTDNKTQLAHACFDLVIEHHAAICLLCDSKLYGSMFALLRVEFEALTKGLWLNHVATCDDIKKYKDEDMNLGFGTTIKLIENQLGFSEGVLHFIKKQQYEIFSSFTHTGYQALVRRVNSTHTGAINYRDDDVIAALRHAGLFILMASAELADMTKNELVQKNIIGMLQNYGE